MEVPQISRPQFILVAPYAEDFCEKIVVPQNTVIIFLLILVDFTHHTQYINKTFHNDKMTVTSCELLKKSESTVGGTILGKYRLVTVQAWLNSQDAAHVDLRTTFLQEQNGPEFGCKFNGYWAPVQLVFRGTMEDFNIFLENSSGNIQEITGAN
ncbi:hypothetical protein CRM22_008769 [Opisthorchis felineus]|nr:hypothetical protein CRM22_008769 [Opisthorchis felineus]TGZ60051.1 hypothetical protein CRM22_008769 [Opisthorchis felineus]